MGVYAADTLVAVIPPSHHSDVAALLDIGLDLTLSLSATGDELVIALTGESAEA